MKVHICFFIYLFCLITPVMGANEVSLLWGPLTPGPYAMGFRKIRVEDSSRVEIGGHAASRQVIVYLWYPAVNSEGQRLLLKEWAALAAEDFYPLHAVNSDTLLAPPHPLPLAKGLVPDSLKNRINRHSHSQCDVPPVPGQWPLLILGQGLYYESPLSQLVLCEYLASHGFIVATCPLMGTHSLQVQLNVEDLETIICDLECAMQTARRVLSVDREKLGVIGYDMGGMAGVTLVMRNPSVRAFMSMDAGIVYRHHSGLPAIHPDYNTEKLILPWLHLTQSRFIEAAKRHGESSLMAQKALGDNYLAAVNTTNHGHFTSYALWGMKPLLSRYWGPSDVPEQQAYHAACQVAVHFFNTYLHRNVHAARHLKRVLSDAPAFQSYIFTPTH